ncbi:META domain-containing protein [uncultured Maribacter sp.]|uniref:META domain-containing protein n=1 Tax=uncultured Maribacter sp. TaxID=431308 RepID=UPI002609657A|nr:META domain-containing protein [uncultured Maribacter sp.]
MKSKVLKTIIFFSLLVLCVIASACSSLNGKINENLFNATWELEFISGPRIAFSGMYPDKKPMITFNETTSKVEGSNSCNGYSADYTLSGKEITFGMPGPTTMMFCGNGERVFLTSIKKINAYTIDHLGRLNLMMDGIVMMRFKNVQKN